MFLHHSKSVNMKISSISFRHFLLPACLGLFLAGCADTSTEDSRIEQAKAAYTVIMDIDNDGISELVIGFKKADLNRLSQKEVVLKGRFSTAATSFETDEFAVSR